MGITWKTKLKKKKISALQATTHLWYSGARRSHCYQDTRVRNKLMRSSWLKSSLISRVQDTDNTWLMYYPPQGVVFLRGHKVTGTVQMCASSTEHNLSKGCWSRQAERCSQHAAGKGCCPQGLHNTETWAHANLRELNKHSNCKVLPVG